MNKKNIITEKNIMKVADFLEEACEHFKKDGEGCYHFNLSEDLALYVGWSDGYDMADTDIIKSKEGQRQHGSWTCGWAVNAAVKVRNDFNCADFEYLNFPWYKDDGDCWNSSLAPRPDYTRRDFRSAARWFLETFVAMTNAHKKGILSYE